jgi:thioredoxin 1
MPTEIQELTRDSFPELVGQSDRPVLVDFWGPQCRPCLALSPTFEELADTYEDLRFLKAAAPSNRMLCVDLKVMALPTFVCMVNGQEVSRLTGEINAARLKEWVKEQSAQAKGGVQLEQ